jgi:hypothetical protein
MRRRLAPLLVLAAVGCLTAPTAPAIAAKHQKSVVFEVCHRGCRYLTIQKAVDAAAGYAYRHKAMKVTVAIRPGRYVEEVVLDGAEPQRRFDGMTIEGTKQDRRRTILEGRGAEGGLGAAQAGISASGVDGLVLRNMWARNYGSAGFLVRGAEESGRPCDDYTMENLLASGNRSFGLVARNCLGGKMIDSAAYRQGAAGFSVAETPCDSPDWNAYAGAPCQVEPHWALLDGDASYENALGYLGANSKYVRIIEGAFYDDGTGIAPASLDGEGREPSGWNMIERNYVFWNNYDYHLAGSAFEPTLAGLGELNGRMLGYPIGVGIALIGGDGDVVRGNHVFGNYKWGIASFSIPGEPPVLDERDEAKNVDNEIVENDLGRGGADPNGEYDIWNDASGGGNCWGANSSKATFAPGGGKVPTAAIYPICPLVKVGYGAVRSLAVEAGLQLPSAETRGAKTILGYLATEPPQDQQCSWVKRVATHPAFQTFEPVEVTARPGELSC